MKLSRRLAAAAALASLFVAPAFVAPASAAETATYREFVEGNKNAKVTVIEYASLTCPHCAQFFINEYPRLKKDFIDTGKIKFIFRDLPTDNLAAAAAMLTRCAPGERGKPMVEALFREQEKWSQSSNPEEELRNQALLAGMNKEAFDACLKNDGILRQLQEVARTAVQKYQVQGTPTFIVDEEAIKGADYATLKEAIEKKLK
jgi:protein-disulfide isomerase